MCCPQPWVGFVRPDSEKMGCVRWGVDWRKRAVYKKSSASTLRVVKMLCVFVFVLNFLSATDPPSARQKAARRNGGPVGESNLEVFLVDSSCALFWDV